LTLVCNMRPDHPGDPPFLVIERCKDGINRPVMSAWKLDDMLLTRLRLADGYRGNQLKIVEDWEVTAKAESNRRYKEDMMEKHDIAASVIASKKSRYTIRDSQTGELITFFDDRPASRK